MEKLQYRFSIIFVQIFVIFLLSTLTRAESINIPIILDEVKELQVSSFLPVKKSLPSSLDFTLTEINKLQKENTTCGKKIISDLSRKLNAAYNKDIYYLKGLVQECCGDLNEAYNSYLASLKIKSDNPKLIMRLAIVSFKLSKYEEAVNYLNEAKWRGFVPAFIGPYIRGLILIKQNKAEDANVALTLSKKLNPNFIPTIKMLRNLKQFQISQIVDPTKRTSLEQEYLNLGGELISRDSNNRTLALEHTRFLFNSGDSLNSPNKLAEASSICDRFITNSNYKDETFILLKIGILKKQSNNDELINLINKVEEAKAMTPQLKAIKDSIVLE